MDILQIRGRSLTQAEARYAEKWLELGFDDAAITMAYERTCLNTGGMNWNYMNKILTRWQEAGLRTGKQVTEGDRRTVPTGASGELGQAEMDALRRVMQEG
jgi:DnaD/phage-associated family protein